MATHEIKQNIWSVGAIDWDRTLFDALVSLPHGTSYNAFLIKGSEKVVLIDTVEPAKKDDLYRNLQQTGVKNIDYIVSNHSEQDHSGSIPDVLDWYPDAKVVTNAKGKGFLMDLLKLPEDVFQVVKDRDTLSLGDKTLEFIFTPWVHWPETMVSYLREDRILFSCDFFGSHVATSDLYVTDRPLVALEAKRYYAEIMMPFARSIHKHLQLLENYEIDIIAPSHGPLYDDPGFIIDAYREWVSDRVKNEVIILYITMHGSTEKLAFRMADALMKRNISVRMFNLMTADVGEIAVAAVDSATILLASPAVLVGAHPAAIYAAYFLNALKPKTRFMGILGSYGWGNKMVDHITANLGSIKAEMLPPLLVKGAPDEESWAALEALAGQIAEKHRELFAG